jgi:excisionase family DNA binding protein
MMEEKLKTGEAARLIGVHIQTIRRWAAAGLIKTLTLPSGQRLVYRSEVERIVGKREHVEKAL